MENSTNGQRSDHDRYPALVNRNVVRLATRMLRVSATGRIISGGTPNSAITARYPDAPACPTDE